MNNGDQPAYPDPMRGAEQSYSNQSPELLHAGLTKREMIAAMAMSGILSNPSCIPTEQVHFLNICEDAIRAADELIKQLETK